MLFRSKLNGWEEDQTSGAELTVNDFNKLNETEDYIINKVVNERRYLHQVEERVFP